MKKLAITFLLLVVSHMGAMEHAQKIYDEILQKIFVLDGQNKVDILSAFMIKNELCNGVATCFTIKHFTTDIGEQLAEKMCSNEIILTNYDLSKRNRVVSKEGSVAQYSYEFGGEWDPIFTLSKK